MAEEDYEKYREELIKCREKITLELRELHKKSKNIKDIDSKEKKEIYELIDNKIQFALQINDILNTIRIPDKKDIENRKNILDNYANSISNLLSINSNYLFYGCSNINKVENVLNGNENIMDKVGDLESSIINAEPGTNTFFPYGAIFVFENNESFFNCKNYLHNLKYIITTDENIDVLKKYYLNFGYNKNIIINHQNFYDICLHKYENKEKERVSVL